MTVLGLDLSLTGSAYAHSPTHWGVAADSGKLRGCARLDALDSWLQVLVAKVEPSLAVIEGYSYGSKISQPHSLGEWGGIARLTLYRMDVPTAIVPPKVLKKYATGNGNAPKPTMRMELYKRCGIDVDDDNAVDAIWLHAAGMEASGAPLFDMPKTNVAALEKVEWPVGVGT